MGDSLQTQLSIEWGVVLAVTLVAAMLDASSRRVPNALTGPAWLLGLAWAAGTGGIGHLGDALAASVILAIPYVLLFLFAGGGAGDAKLMGAVGAWLGISQGVVALLAIALSGALLAVAYALYHQRLRSVLGYVRQVANAGVYFVCHRGGLEKAKCFLRERQDMTTMPYGVAVFMGACIAAGVTRAWG